MSTFYFAVSSVIVQKSAAGMLEIFMIETAGSIVSGIHRPGS